MSAACLLLGLQTDRGLLLGEEPHVLQLSGSLLLCFWRTELGFLDSRYSNDYGETWYDSGLPQPLQYSPGSLDSLTKSGTSKVIEFLGLRQ